MLEYLRELMNYTAWADAEFFRSWTALTDSHNDQELRVRTDHMVAVQDAFLKFIKEEPTERPNPNAPPADFGSLHERAIQNHLKWKNFLAEITNADLQKPLRVPWFSNAPVNPTFGEAILQVVMHSQHHRAQNMHRLRELGSEKVVVDYILWVLKGRSEPKWGTLQL